MSDCTESESEAGATDCRDAVEELYTYLDGHLDDERRSLIRGHLEACSPCLSAFEFHEELRNLVTEKCKSDMPDGLRDRVFAALTDLGSESSDGPDPEITA